MVLYGDESQELYPGSTSLSIREAGASEDLVDDKRRASDVPQEIHQASFKAKANRVLFIRWWCSGCSQTFEHQHTAWSHEC